MKKQILLTFLFLLPVMAIADGDYLIDGIYYSVYNGKASVKSSGYWGVDGYYVDKKNYKGDIVIPETIEVDGQSYPVTEIGSNTFEDCKELTTIKLPQNIKSIGSRAFYGCINLSEIIIPANVNSIGSNVFYNCKGLKSIIVENGNTTYDSRENCNAIIETRWARLLSGCSSTIIPDGVTSIAIEAFHGTGIKAIDIPNSIQTIKSGAFSDCTNLENVTLHEGLETIEYLAFRNCTSLKSIVIPSSVTNIQNSSGGYDNPVNWSRGNYPFEGCIGLESIKVVEGNTVYDSRDNCNAIIDSQTNTLLVGCKNTIIPEGVTDIFPGAFQFCSTLEKIHIPSSVITMNYGTFIGCTGLKEITVDSNNPYWDSRDNCNAIIDKISNTLVYGCVNTHIPQTVETIGSYAFFHYDKQLNLPSIIIPENVNSIYRGAFYSCRLETVFAKNAQIPLGSSSFSNRSYQHAMLYIPVGTWSQAIYDRGWYLFNNIREIAMEVRELSPSLAYTLINTNNSEYAVVDNTSNDVRMEKAFYTIDENDPKTSWQIVNRNGHYYLYNIGAKKYASISSNGELLLSTEPQAVTLDNGENGIVLGNSKNHTWGFVLNEKVQAEASLTAIEQVENDSTEKIYYSINGQKTKVAKGGLYIIRDKRGNTKKVLMR